MLKKSFLSAIFLLAVAGLVRADQITTNATIFPPGQPSTAGVTNLDGGVGGGMLFVNTAATGPGGTAQAGDVTRGVGATPLLSFNTLGGGFGLVSSPGNTIVASFAIMGTISSAGGTGLNASLTSGVLQVFNIHGTAFNLSNPATWGPTTMGATLLASYNLTNNPGNIFSVGLGENIFVPAAAQNQVGTDFTSVDVTGQTNFTKAFDNLLQPPLPFDAIQIKTTDEFTTNTNAFLTGSGLMGLDDTFNALLGGPFQPPGDPFNALGNGLNGDFIANFGAHIDPTQVITAALVPEIDPASMAGALAMLGAGWMMLTARRRKRN
jgi:hypothetical protein